MNTVDNSFLTDFFNILVIGDVHGKINQYWKLLQNHDGNSIQVGDFGFRKEHEWFLRTMDCNKHRINFGNHDDYSFLKKPHSLSDWSWIPHQSVMTVRGAYSIDAASRIENIDWWRNEELNYAEMTEAVDFYKWNTPKIMITHDCPKSVKSHLFGIEEKSITTNGLQAMFEIHQPELWIFGHHHKHKNEIIDGTRFICLEELQTIYI